MGVHAMYNVDAAASTLPCRNDDDVDRGKVLGMRARVEILLRGAEVGDTLLHLAAKFGAPRIVRALLALGAPVRTYTAPAITRRGSRLSLVSRS